MSSFNVIFEDLGYFGDIGQRRALWDLMARDGLSEGEARDGFSPDELREHAMDLMDLSREARLDELAAFLDGRGSEWFPEGRNPNAGNPALLRATCDELLRSEGLSDSLTLHEDPSSALDLHLGSTGVGRLLPYFDLARIWERGGELHMDGGHLELEVRQLTDLGASVTSPLGRGGRIPEGGIEVAGGAYLPGDEGRLLADLWGDPALCDTPSYIDRAYGIGWGVDIGLWIECKRRDEHARGMDDVETEGLGEDDAR